MRRPLAIALLVAAVSAGAMTPRPVFAENENSFNFGIGGIIQTMPHCKATVYILEYEHMLSPKIAFLGRASEIVYQSDDSVYLEEGRPKGADIGARYYLSGGMQGLFIGGTLGYWSSDWTFTQNKGRLDEFRGTGNTDSLRANVDIGGRFPIGSSSVSLMPAFNIGKFFSSTSCEYTAPASRVGTACTQDTDVEFYMFLALTVGIGF